MILINVFSYFRVIKNLSWNSFLDDDFYGPFYNIYIKNCEAIQESNDFDQVEKSVISTSLRK